MFCFIKSLSGLLVSRNWWYPLQFFVLSLLLRILHKQSHSFSLATHPLIFFFFGWMSHPIFCDGVLNNHEIDTMHCVHKINLLMHAKIKQWNFPVSTTCIRCVFCFDTSVNFQSHTFIFLFYFFVGVSHKLSSLIQFTSISHRRKINLTK